MRNGCCSKIPYNRSRLAIVVEILTVAVKICGGGGVHVCEGRYVRYLDCILLVATFF